MKEYNRAKWWIASDIIGDITISADYIETALKEYQNIVKNKYYIQISDNALKTRNNMYIDTETGTRQTGFVITAKSDFEDRDNYRYTQQYINLWVHISIIQNPFEEITQ